MKPPSKLKVLVVDDDPVYRQMATVYLGMGGYDVATAENGAVALEVLATRQFDLALFDVEMPVMGGLELLQRIGKQGILPEMPTMMATSREDIPIIDRAFELGASGFTVKPVNWGLLVHEMRFVLRAAANEKAAGTARDEALRLSALKDQILSVVRHELRSPLQSIIGYGKLVAKGAEASGDASLADNARAMTEGGERLDTVISGMMLHLDLQAGRVTADREAEPMSGLLEVIEQPARRRLSDVGCACSVIDDSGGASVSVQAVHVAWALERVVDNVRKHARATEAVLSARKVSDGEVCFEIVDNGAGLPAAVLQETTRAFTQGGAGLSRTVEGMGLGFAIIEGLVKLNGGRLELSNHPSGGAAVRLVFPTA